MHHVVKIVHEGALAAEEGLQAANCKGCSNTTMSRHQLRAMSALGHDWSTGSRRQHHSALVHALRSPRRADDGAASSE